MPTRKAPSPSAKPRRGQEPKNQPKEPSTLTEGKAQITYEISITKNLGNYESLKIHAGITVPHGASMELLDELDELMVVSREKVVSRLSKDLDGVTSSLTT